MALTPSRDFTLELAKTESGMHLVFPQAILATATEFQDPGNKIFGLPALSVLWVAPVTIAGMSTLPDGQHLLRTFGVGGASLLVCFLAGSLILSADTPSELRSATVGTCYCHCAESKALGSCVKMCESPKYAARRWATTCAKPRLKLPVENRDAGPRFPHPGRSERAQISKSTSAS